MRQEANEKFVFDLNQPIGKLKFAPMSQNPANISQNPSQLIKLLESGADEAKFKWATTNMTNLPRAQLSMSPTGLLSFRMTQFLSADCSLKTLTWIFTHFISP